MKIFETVEDNPLTREEAYVEDSIRREIQSIDAIISAARRDKAAQIQSWIDATGPTPMQILRRIAEESPPHAGVLTLICDELEKSILSKMADEVSVSIRSGIVEVIITKRITS